MEVESPAGRRSGQRRPLRAEPYANLADDSLIALYMVLKNPKLGIIVKQPVKVEPDPGDRPAGRDHRRNPPAALLATSACTSARAAAARWSPRRSAAPTRPRPSSPPGRAQAPTATTSSFQIVTGPGGGPCPRRHAALRAGLRRPARQQRRRRLLALLDAPDPPRRRPGPDPLRRHPAARAWSASWPGSTDAPMPQIALAKAKTGRAELASPSCPANSRDRQRDRPGRGSAPSSPTCPARSTSAGPYGGAPL